MTTIVWFSEQIMIRLIGAFGLFSLILAGCANDADTFDVKDGQGHHATAKSLPPGATIQDCLDLMVTGDTGWDTSSFTGTEAWCPDGDEDGYYDASATAPFDTGCLCIIAGTLSSEYAQVDESTVLLEDCDDTTATVTGADTTVYTDVDSDGYGDDATMMMACGTDGYATVGGDCDDSAATTNPGASEICDAVDNDCDGIADDGLATTDYYTDADRDGYGSGMGTASCADPGAGYSTLSTDCDDTDGDINPDGIETCNGVDDNCDGMTDADDDNVIDAQLFNEDDDGDGFGNPDSTVTACELPESGYVANDDDCDDTDETISPDAMEVCDDVDNDCDGLSDDADSDAMTFTGSESWPDADRDGYGDMDATGTWSCDIPSGQVEDDTDCDDAVMGINPGATETADDGIDQDCDGEDLVTPADDDADGDGFDSEDSGGDDCNDADAAVNPDATDVDNDGLDNNCDGEAQDYVCVTPSTPTVAWELLLSDMTAYPWTPGDPNWGVAYADGTGELCGSFPIIAGNSLKIQGPFDQNGDGVYGAYDGFDYWLFMTSTNSFDSATVMGIDITTDVTVVTWDGDGDGDADGSDGVVVELPPELPYSVGS